MNLKIFFAGFLLAIPMTLSAQDEQYQSFNSKSDINSLINKFKPLIVKLHTYKTYSPPVFTMDKNDAVDMQMVMQEPNDINLFRTRLVSVLGNSLATKKAMLVCFVEDITHPSDGKNRKAISIYAEHIDEPLCYVYYLPYKKTMFGKIKFYDVLKFREETPKLVLK